MRPRLATLTLALVLPVAACTPPDATPPPAEPSGVTEAARQMMRGEGERPLAARATDARAFLALVGPNARGESATLAKSLIRTDSLLRRVSFNLTIRGGHPIPGQSSVVGTAENRSGVDLVAIHARVASVSGDTADLYIDELEAGMPNRIEQPTALRGRLAEGVVVIDAHPAP